MNRAEVRVVALNLVVVNPCGLVVWATLQSAHTVWVGARVSDLCYCTDHYKLVSVSFRILAVGAYWLLRLAVERAKPLMV